MLILIIVLGIIVFFLLSELPCLVVCGWPKTDSEYLQYLDEIKNNNPYLISGASKNSMISTFTDRRFISNSIKSGLFGCYIEDMGCVPRWYKSYREIKKLYNELENK